MKVRIIKKQTIEKYIENNSQSRTSLLRWINLVKIADWNEPSDIQKTFGTADLLGNGTMRVVFNIGGNNYRLICKYRFGINKIRLYIYWIGTHAEYDKLCDEQKQYTIKIY